MQLNFTGIFSTADQKPTEDHREGKEESVINYKAKEETKPTEAQEQPEQAISPLDRKISDQRRLIEQADRIREKALANNQRSAFLQKEILNAAGTGSSAEDLIIMMADCISALTDNEAFNKQIRQAVRNKTVKIN